MSEVREVELSSIQLSKLNPRIDINPQELSELIKSIQEVGILHPIILRPLGQEKYEVVVGQRRLMAAKKLGFKTIPSVIRSLSDEEVVELNLVENIHRAELSAVEKGQSCKELMKKYPKVYPNIEAVALKIGVSGTTLRSWLKLTDAPAELQKMVAPTPKLGVPRERGKIDWDTAVSIARRVKDKGRQVEIAKAIASNPIYGRDARKVIARVVREPQKPVKTVVQEVMDTPFSLPFRLSHMQPIIDGSKMQTSRKGIPDPKVKVGAVIQAAVWEPHFADLEITSIEKKRLGQFTEEDAKREGGYTLDEFKNVWKGIHGNWNDRDLVYVIQFKRTRKNEA
jgi:ParB/RepB/Spo0J family partition protein